MTLSELALLVGAEPKWLLNAAAVLPLPKRYGMALATRLALTRALREGPGVPLPRAYELAGEALRHYTDDGAPVVLAPDPSGAVVIEVDVHRILAELNTRRSRLATMHAPRRRGRKPAARPSPLNDARKYGLDLSLLSANLRRTPAERLRQLDSMVRFRQQVRRVPPAR